MIESAERHFPRQEWIVADMRALPCGGSISGILAWIVLSPLPRRPTLDVSGVSRACGAESALMFTSGPAHGEAIGSFGGEPLYHASLDPAEYRSLLDQNGFRVVSHVVEDPGCGGHTIWLAQLI